MIWDKVIRCFIYEYLNISYILKRKCVLRIGNYRYHVTCVGTLTLIFKPKFPRWIYRDFSQLRTNENLDVSIVVQIVSRSVVKDD